MNSKGVWAFLIGFVMKWKILPGRPGGTTRIANPKRSAPRHRMSRVRSSPRCSRNVILSGSGRATEWRALLRLDRALGRPAYGGLLGGLGLGRRKGRFRSGGLLGEGGLLRLLGLQ